MYQPLTMEVNDYDKNKKNENPSGNYQAASNTNACDLDEETNTKLRGDAIGDTLYSQSFVLKTLLTFSDLKWDEEIEEDLCFLWDMTVEKDVCKYLFEISFPSLACSTIDKCTENRFIEIVIGILANILCADCDKNITEEEIHIILKELDTADSLILIQLARFISTIAHMFQELPFISENILNKIKFILCNSTNNDLLLKTLEAVAKLTSSYKLEKSLINLDIINSSLTAYRSIIINENHFELDTRDKQLACRHMLEIVSNVCSYITRFDDNELLLEFKKMFKCIY
ncbi:hypothetical protein NQ314_004509 [Rhamnusium bicolor]|uniref:Protein saal1 n=1 Tax=Rhamnusium bicolor TaxID=1586634 RepID=A0AAV8ZJS8_9CUCU|nr:hypothetical protein NQ314_004509 [Rhamnusium bicolor]